MRRRRYLFLALAALTASACTDRSPLAPSLEVSGDEAAPSLDVLTWNVYVGARLENLLLVQDPNQIPFEVAAIVGQVVATDFPSRAEAIADQIEATRPDVISLQEVSEFRTQSPGDFLAGNPVAASTPFLDWLQILGDALAARGLSYDVAVRSQNFDIELPMVNFSTGGLDDVRLTDYDVVLVRSGVYWTNAASGNFAAALPIDLGGVQIAKPSGWASVDLDVAGEWYRYVNTHLEAADLAPGVVDPDLAALQAGQLYELSQIMDGSPHPVILTGDLNSAADGSTTTAYEDLLDDGFVDIWRTGQPRGAGYTANQAPDLQNATSQLYHRIDFVLFRNALSGTSGHLTGSARAELLGESPADRTPGGLWPSDHAGVYAELMLAPGAGNR